MGLQISQETTREEKMSIYKALIASDPFLASPGMGGGHFYTCPNGHIYVIGECGGAMQVACKLH